MELCGKLVLVALYIVVESHNKENQLRITEYVRG